MNSRCGMKEMKGNVKNGTADGSLSVAQVNRI